MAFLEFFLWWLFGVISGMAMMIVLLVLRRDLLMALMLRKVKENEDEGKSKSNMPIM